MFVTLKALIIVVLYITYPSHNVASSVLQIDVKQDSFLQKTMLVRSTIITVQRSLSLEKYVYVYVYVYV